MTDMMNFSHGWGMGSGMWILPIVFWALIIAGIFIILNGFLSQPRSHNVNPPHTEHAPLDILKTRYAKGEIDKETYERMRKELEE